MDSAIFQYASEKVFLISEVSTKDKVWKMIFVFSPCVFQQAVAELLLILSGWSVGLIQHVADVFSQIIPWFER